MQPVRIGLVGYGKGGRFFHAPLITAAAGCELAGVEAAQPSAVTGQVVPLTARSGPYRRPPQACRQLSVR